MAAATQNLYLTVVVWALRLLLPCLLFWISFGPKIQLPWHTRRRHSRETLLRHRELVLAEGAKVPDSLATLSLASEENAPALFQERRSASKEESRERPEGAGRRREREREEGAPRGDRRERDRDRRERGERRRASSPVPPLDGALPEADAAPAVDAEQVAAEERRMHLESLVNFVAFNRHRPKRYFLFEGAPPPPPKPPKPRPKSPLASVAAGTAATKADADIHAAAVARANAEAQMVLRGSLRLPSQGSAVARGLHAQLFDLGLQVAPATYELMVEATIEAQDLPAASEFLMKMESSGHAPGNELLDKVMELYLRHKRVQELEGGSPPRGTERRAPLAGAARPAPPLPAPSASASSSSGGGAAPRHSPFGAVGAAAVPGGPLEAHLPAWASSATLHEPCGGYDCGMDPGVMAEALAPGMAAGSPMLWGMQMGPLRPGALPAACAAPLGARRRRGVLPTAQPPLPPSGGAAASRADLPAFCVPDEFAAKPPPSESAAATDDGAADQEGAGDPEAAEAPAGEPAPSPDREEEEGPAVAEASPLSPPSRALTVAALQGRWYRNGDPSHCWTVDSTGRCLFNGRYPGAAYDLMEDSADGEMVIFAAAHRENGEELDLQQSTSDRLVWVHAVDGSFSAAWDRAPEPSPAPPASAAGLGLGLSADAAEFVPRGSTTPFAFSADAPAYDPQVGGSLLLEQPFYWEAVGGVGLRPSAAPFIPSAELQPPAAHWQEDAACGEAPEWLEGCGALGAPNGDRLHRAAERGPRVGLPLVPGGVPQADALPIGATGGPLGQRTSSAHLKAAAPVGYVGGSGLQAWSLPRQPGLLQRRSDGC